MLVFQWSNRPYGTYRQFSPPIKVRADWRCHLSLPPSNLVMSMMGVGMHKKSLISMYSLKLGILDIL